MNCSLSKRKSEERKAVGEDRAKRRIRDTQRGNRDRQKVLQYALRDLYHVHDGCLKVINILCKVFTLNITGA